MSYELRVPRHTSRPIVHGSRLFKTRNRDCVNHGFLLKKYTLSPVFYVIK